MWPFKRKRTGAPHAHTVHEADHISDVRALMDDAPSLTKEVRPVASPSDAMRPGAGIFRILPIGRILDQLTGILRDPNGKISSKRAGAGALVVAGIGFLAEPDTFQAGIVCLVAAVALFALTKYDQ